MNTIPSFAGQSAVAALRGAGELHAGGGVEVDNVVEELIIVEVEDSSEEVEVIISSDEVEVERSLEVVAVACSSLRSSSSIVAVIGSEVELGSVSVVLDESVNTVDDTSEDEVVDVGSHTPISMY